MRASPASRTTAALRWALVIGSLFCALATPGRAIGRTPIYTAEADAVRLLEQSTWGPSTALVTEVIRMGPTAFVDAQLALPPTPYTAFAPWPANRPAECVDVRTPPLTATSYCARDNYSLFQLQREFFSHAVAAPDQLRQRVAFALSQILVVSGTEVRQVYAMQRYQQRLADLAFGNFKDVLTEVTLSPAMGIYLDMVNNQKPNTRTGTQPNENYAREALQLFSIGTVELNLDGTPLLDAQEQPIAAYDQAEIEGFAHVFTGWTYPTAPGALPRAGLNPKYFDGPLEERPQFHDFGAKHLLDDVTAPSNLRMSVDLANAIDNIFQHPNVAPFIAKQLIQKLVTSNPSPGYVERVATVFNDNGGGVRGDLKAVVRALLLDPEARGPVKDSVQYGRLREPAQLVVAVARALDAKSDGVFLRAQAAALGQPVFNAPSVFNFYPPDYAIPNTTVVGPEFALQNTTTALARINFINTLVYGSAVKPDPTVYGATGTELDWRAFTALAADPEALVDRLDRLLLHGTLSSSARELIVNAIKAVPAKDALGRAKAAFYLIASSSQYQVER